MASAVPSNSSPTTEHTLEIYPESALPFVLNVPASRNGVPRCEMTLTNPSASASASGAYLAFKVRSTSLQISACFCVSALKFISFLCGFFVQKVKTTQPRRYLVRPNQGIIAPGKSETVSIILVEKDKQILLQSFETLGQSALDHSKDKFLVQSRKVSSEELIQLGISEETETNKLYMKDFTDMLTSLWNKAMVDPDVNILAKKLHVKHVVSESLDPNANATLSSQASALSSSTAANLHQQPLSKMEGPPMEAMTQEQMLTEVSSLRRKYDELVAFSINLTAERDILNNTLEQTKRDLNREMAARSALENSGGKESKMQQRQMQMRHGKIFNFSVIQITVVAIACFIAGIKAGQHETTSGYLAKIPMISNFLGL